MRALLEGYAARRAAAVSTTETVADLYASCERFARPGNESEDDVRRLVEENLRFHNLILEIAGSPRLAAMVRQVTVLPLV